MWWFTFLLSFFEIGFPGDVMSQVSPSKNGDLLVAGSIFVEEDDHCDTYISRLSADAKTVKWEKSYGWIKDDHAYAVGEYPDGTIQVVGDTWSTGNGFSDAYFLFLDATGELLWEQDFGGQGIDTMEAFAFLSQSIVAVGMSASYGGAIDGLPWAMGVDQDGQPLWNVVVGKEHAGRFHDVARTRKGIVAVGEIDISPDLEESDSAVRHVLIVKFSKQGTVLWEKHVLLGYNPEARAIVSLRDGGFLIAGSTQKSPQHSRDGFVLRVNGSGIKLSSKLYGGMMDDAFSDVVMLSANHFLATGSTASFGATSQDVWFRGASLGGATLLNKRFGSGDDDEQGSSITRLKNGKLAFTGNHYVGQVTLINP